MYLSTHEHLTGENLQLCAMVRTEKRGRARGKRVETAGEDLMSHREGGYLVWTDMIV